MRDAMRYLVVLALGMSMLGWPAGGAVAADSPPELLWQTPDDGLPGDEAGRMDVVRGVAASPTTGRVFVVEQFNARISEFTAWGEFVKAWGFGVEDGEAELQSCTTETGCQAGQQGGAPGQLGVGRGLAVDSSDAVYVFDETNNRVTKYSAAGDFLLMFGGNVNETTGAEVCTAADVAGGDDCGPGASGSAPGFFENETFGNFIAATADTVYVGDKGRIQAFNLDGTFKGEIPFTGSLAVLAGVSPFGLAVDPVSGDIYVSTDRAGDPIYRISPAGVLVDEVEDTIQVNSEPKTFPVIAASIAVDSKGSLYVVDHRVAIGFHGPFEVLKFDPAGKCLICGAKFAQPDELEVFGRSMLGLATGNACGIPGDDIYVTISKGAPNIDERIAYVQSYGPAPQDVVNCPPPEVAPSILDQFAITAGTGDAEVGARINPRFWNDTTYYVQYGPQECLDSGWTSGCSTEPLPPGALLTDKVVNQALATEGVQLEGLEPDTVYHFRFVAESSGGGPVFGVDGTEAEEGESSSFRTFPVPLPARSDCTNQEFRTGLSALLVDCRGYEMVSPVDKNGGDILTQQSIQDYPAELNITALDGESATYSSQVAFADSVSAPYVSQYLAKRDPSAGWLTEAISPPREEIFSPAGKAELYELDNQYKLFSPDLHAAWLMHEADPPLDECAVEGFINWYKRDNATGSYEAVTTKLPPTKTPLTYLPEVQGAGVDGEGRTHTVYRASDKLAVDSGVAAANITGYQIYEHISDPGGGCGETRLVSVLPNGTAWNQESSAGTSRGSAATSVESRENLVHNAVSADGNIVYWTAAGGGPGKIYVRVEGVVTFPVSTGAARFWLAAEDGSVAYYTENEDKTLKVFNLGGATTTVTTQMMSLLGASEDGSRAYFVSKEDLDGSGDAETGKPNIYLLEEAVTTHVATLSSTDAALGVRLRPTSDIPVRQTSSVSEDGEFLVFPSDAGFTGSDNTDILSGLPDTEVYLYEAGSDQLRCVSCSFTGVRPSGRVIVGIGAVQGYAAGIPPWKNQFHKPRVISEDGSKVFFESLERLVPRDENGVRDVYQWRRAGSEAACEAAGAELFNPVAGGCISLISSGTGSGDASFVDSTPDGSDVFFKTPASLLPQDPGRVDLYDARVGGGFPQPPVPICEVNPEADECRKLPDPDPPVTPPNSGTGGGQFNQTKCERLRRKAHGFAAKARRLRAKAAKAQGQKAEALRKKAKKQAGKANRLFAESQRCFTGARGK